MNEDIESLLFSYLLREQTKVTRFSNEQEDYIIKLSARYLMAGFILEANRVDRFNVGLISSLKKQRRLATIKYMTMKQDLLNIAEVFNAQNVDFLVLKGMALTIGGIYKPGIRAFRDIDLLVPKANIPIAYEALKSIGFKYIDPRTADRATFFLKNHFPVMTNKQGTLLELHWRVTGTDSFQDCPLTEAIFDQRQESDTQKGIHMPNVAGMMAHTLYHGLTHHHLDHGPLFLFDLAAMYKFNQNQWPTDNSLIKQLDLLDEFENCKRLIEMAAKEQDFSMESKTLINELFEGFDWSIHNKELRFSLFGIFDKRISIAEILTKLKNKIQAVSHMYQLPITSPRYWFLLIRDLLRVTKKIRL